MSVKDKVIVITGASSGIGEASAKLLAKNGAKLVLGARREERLKEIVDQIIAAGGQATYQSTDVTQPGQVKALVQLAKDRFGGIDVIFNNAGIMPSSPISALHIDEWNAMIDINLKGVLNGVAAVMPDFTSQKHGQIITTSSVAGIKSFPGAGVYGATKFAVRNLMEVIRMESARKGQISGRPRYTQPQLTRSYYTRLPIKIPGQGWIACTIRLGLAPMRLLEWLTLPLINQKTLT